MGLQAKPTVFAQDFRDTSTAQQHQLGVMGETIDGRRYRYSLAGGTDLAAGKVNVAAAHAANHVNQAVAVAAAAGATKVTVTLGATAATENQYADGYLVINDAAGEGIAYLIENHAAADASASLVVKLAEPIKVALTTSSEYSLIKNPYKDIIVAPGAIAHRAVGVNNVLVDDADYAWVQVAGDCPVLSDGIIAKGACAILSDAVAGAVETEAATGVNQRIGIAPEATVDTEYRLINLMIG